MARKEFFLGILGLTRIERTLVASVCSLTQSRSHGYTILSDDHCNEADFILVDADNRDALERWESSPMCRNGLPALLICAGAKESDGRPYKLSRRDIGARLVKVLDQIVMQEATLSFVARRSNASTPNTGAASTAVGTVSQSGSGRWNAPRALLIDDSEVARTRVRSMLESNGLQVSLASDAEQALGYMRRYHYDIVFLDVQLPGIDGYAACRQMKSQSRDAPPIVMLTGRDSTFDKIRGVMAGCSRYLTKPIVDQALTKVVQDLVPQSGAVQ